MNSKFIVPIHILCVLLASTLCKGDMSSWPQGQYGLLEPQTGCPEGWPQKTGWIYQDTEDTNPSNNHSQTLHIQGSVGASYVLRSFCLKTISTGITWPKGRYCVYNKYSNNCPSGSGLQTGSIRWDDEDTRNKDTYRAPLCYYDNHYNNLRLVFCCSTTGTTSSPIQLPITKPFYLLPYGSSKCQQVEWMVASSEWIAYDKENTGTDYSDQSGTVPYHTLNDYKDITMYYCYYQSCNYTLDTAKGSFQSPGYPNNYTDGQRCSWQISVPVNHTVLVTFLTFSMATNNDTLDYYTKRNGSYELVHRYSSGAVPGVVTSESSDVMFVFWSDAENSSRGFRADYEVVPTEDLFTTTKATSTLKPTTIPTATQLKTTRHASPTTIARNENAPPAKASGSDDKSTILLIVIPLACCVLVVVVSVDIWYRCRHRKCTHADEKIQLNPDMVVNDIYDCEMIVSQCSTTTRRTGHKTHRHDNQDDVYQNTNEGYYSDEVQNSPTHPTLVRTASQPNDYYLDPLDETPVALGMKEVIPRDDTEAEYGNIDSPRVVSGEYGYIQPLEYVPRNSTDDVSISRVSDETPTRDREDSDASYLEPLECVNDGNKGNHITDMGEPIYEYDNVCETLDDDDIYANVN